MAIARSDLPALPVLVTGRNHAAALVFLTALVLVAAVLYISESRRTTGGDLLIMPLDDTYIHFQYAKMIALGQPFRYGPGEPYTSGATSLLYPFVLAVGYKIGFTGLNLAWWAVGIGVLSWIGSVRLFYEILQNKRSQVTGRDQHVAPFSYTVLAITVAFALVGSLGFAFMSGMETGLFVFSVLLTLYAVERSAWRGAALAGLLAALLRPEGTVIAVSVAAYGLAAMSRGAKAAALNLGTGTRLANGETQTGMSVRPRFSPVDLAPGALWLILPLLASIAQPLLNLALTGSATASGLQAKSYLYNVPFDWGTAMWAIIGTFFRIWGEWFTGFDRDGVLYTIPVLLAVLAAGYIVWSLTRRKAVSKTLLVLFWLLGISAALSLLETASWQFKRYQQPMLTLLFVFAGYALIAINRRRISIIGSAALVGGSVLTFAAFRLFYASNAEEVARVQIPMARYVASITQPTDRIAVHDIGVMAYVGERPVYDVVGLATANAAQAWRSGPGALYEVLRSAPQRPAYFAIYDEPHGLAYLYRTRLFLNPLRIFPSIEIAHNVASASTRQIVTKPDWTLADQAPTPLQSSIQSYLVGMLPVDSLNVADLADEARHGYVWKDGTLAPGYATELYEMRYRDCTGACTALDGGRVITGSEAFTIKTQPGKALLWIIRVHPREAAELAIYADDQPIGTKIQPGDLGGKWIDIPILVRGDLVKNTQTRLRVEVRSGTYMPYQQWFYQGEYHPDQSAARPTINARFGDRARLLGASITTSAQNASIDMEWEATGEGAPLDANIFVHLYKDATEPPPAQADLRPGNGALPFANWLPGVRHEHYTVPLPAEPGTYQVAVGLYNPLDGVRVPITQGAADADNRVVIGTIEVP